MPSPDAHTLPVHPHQLEVQEFDAYALIVDLRSAADFARDHIPGAVSVPWRPAMVSTGGGGLALQASEPGARLPRTLQARLAGLRPDDLVLLCCDTGGRDAAALAQSLAADGINADVLPGGWSNYQRWVSVGLEVLARVLNLVPVRGSAGAVSAVMSTLHAHGVQACDLCVRAAGAGLAVSTLVDRLRRMDPQRPVWVGLPAGDAGLPAPLHDAVRQRTVLHLPTDADAPVDGSAVLRLTDLSPAVIWQALHVLPEPWPSRLQRDPDQSSP